MVHVRNLKLQISNKSQKPISKQTCLGHFVIGNWNLFDIWLLRFVIPSLWERLLAAMDTVGRISMELTRIYKSETRNP